MFKNVFFFHIWVYQRYLKLSILYPKAHFDVTQINLKFDPQAEKTRRTKTSMGNITKSEKGKHKNNPIENLVPPSPCPV